MDAGFISVKQEKDKDSEFIRINPLNAETKLGVFLIEHSTNTGGYNLVYTLEYNFGTISIQSGVQSGIQSGYNLGTIWGTICIQSGYNLDTIWGTILKQSGNNLGTI